ncbi:hypothetical protein NX059_010560 [Plenodomus lindquistii]|nr:hypothetical protein NX059_010560 [Plenodomus lindquistii]
MSNIFKAALAALAVAPLATGHTWAEQLRNINSKGQYVGQYGYHRNFLDRSDPGWNEEDRVWRLPNEQDGLEAGQLFIDEQTPLCMPSQTKPVQSEKWPRLKSPAGGWVAIRYTENGHVSFPDTPLGHAKNGGTVFVYGTTEPQEDEKLFTVLQWTKDGQGGNKKGVLLSTSDYDDGRCYEKNGTPLSAERQKADPNFMVGQAQPGQPGNSPLRCEADVHLPEDAPEGKPYTLYWVWQWNIAAGTPGVPTGKDEYYTTCMDVDITSEEVAMAALSDQKYALGPQDDMSMAVSNWQSRTAIYTDAAEGEVGPIFSAKPTGAPTGGASRSTGAPSPTATAPASPADPPAMGGAPFLNSTMPAITDIPTLTGRPGASPTSLPPAGAIVTVTDIVMVTVTATPGPAVTPRAVESVASYSARYPYGAKFRGRFAA